MWLEEDEDLLGEGQTEMDFELATFFNGYGFGDGSGDGYGCGGRALGGSAEIGDTLLFVEEVESH